MKLIDLLVQELPKHGGWPEFDEELTAVQDSDREVKFHIEGFRLDFGLNRPGLWGSDTHHAWFAGAVKGDDFTPSVLSDDYQTSTVSRLDYEAVLSLRYGKSDFESLAKAMMKWINDNGHPHQTIIIDATSAVLYSGEKSITTEEFIKD